MVISGQNWPYLLMGESCQNSTVVKLGDDSNNKEIILLRLDLIFLVDQAILCVTHSESTKHV